MVLVPLASGLRLSIFSVSRPSGEVEIWRGVGKLQQPECGTEFSFQDQVSNTEQQAAMKKIVAPHAVAVAYHRST